ncbi:MAG: flagellar export chaperone FliS [Sideroxyarcus sp.]|nr:flagellar export chaperone FliS [Sideroxyarcus sp.]
MFGSAQNGANACTLIGVETGVTSASPHELVVMLFEGALIAVSQALQHMNAGDVPGKGQAISKAIMIISGGLRASIDKKSGGDIANILDEIYEYMCNRLSMANLKNQPEWVEEVHRLLKELKEAWETIGNTGAAPAPKMELPIGSRAYDPLEPHSTLLGKA